MLEIEQFLDDFIDERVSDLRANSSVYQCFEENADSILKRIKEADLNLANEFQSLLLGLGQQQIYFYRQGIADVLNTKTILENKGVLK